MSICDNIWRELKRRRFEMFKKLIRRLQDATPKQLVVASVFMVAMASAISLGLATRQQTNAATVRECTTNSIDYKNINGGCGAANTSEYIADLRSNNPSDLQTIAKNFTSSFNLQPSEYDDFKSHAKQGMAYKDGHVVVDGQTVLTGAWSIGRHVKGYSTKMTIPGAGTFHKSRSQDVFAVNQIPVMVYFNKDGSVKFIAMNPCGNLMGGTKIVPKATCKALNGTQDKTNPNKWTFTTSADFSNNASLDHLEYTFTDTGETVKSNSLTAPISHTFKKSGTVTVKVFAKVPGNHVILAQVVNCSKQVTYQPPVAACVNLVASALDEQKRKFRFTVTAKTDQHTKLVSADFTLDNTQTTAGVTQKDDKGNIYNEYTFTDANKHTVVAKVNFTTLEGAKSVTCQASVTPAELPKCTVPGHENLPPDSPECAYCTVPGHETLPKDSPECAYCDVPGHETLPKDSPDCKPETPPTTPPTTPPAELPKTGISGVAGIFAGTSTIGAVAHRVFASRRRK